MIPNFNYSLPVCHNCMSEQYAKSKSGRIHTICVFSQGSSYYSEADRDTNRCPFFHRRKPLYRHHMKKGGKYDT